MGVNKVIYNGTTLIDLTGDTVTADTLAEGVVAHDKRGETIVGTMKPSSGGDTHITEVGVMIDGEPVTIRDDGSRLTTVVNDDESIVETRTFLDGTIETKTTVFNADETVTETTVANGETTTKKTTFTDLGEIVMCTDNGNQVRFGESEPNAIVGIDGDVFVRREERLTVDCTPIEYIESTGAQFINTNIVGKTGLKVKGKFSPTTTAASIPIGCYGANRCYMLSLTDNNAVRYGYINWYTSSKVLTAGEWYDFEIDFSSKNQSLKIDGVTVVSSANTTDFVNNYNVYVFAYNDAGNAGDFFKGKFSNLEFYYNDVLVCDYIAALDNDGVACFYDLKNNTYAYNGGSGVFLAGSEINNLEGLPTKIVDVAMYMKINGAWTLLAEVA